MLITKIKGFLSFLFFWLIAISTYGQAYNFINYDIGDGLAHERIMDICEDKFGNLWLATAGGGLSKFNGIEFENITIKNGLPSNYVRSILCSMNGDIWAATASGISRYNGKDFTIYQVDSLNENGNSVNKIFESNDGTIWFADPQGGLGKIDTLGRMTIATMPEMIGADKVIDINEDEEGNLWIITAIQGLIKYNNGRFTEVLTNSDFKGYLLSMCIKGNKLWISSNKGLLSFDPKNLNYELVLKNTFIKSANVIDVDEFWTVSALGALKYDNGKIKHFSKNQGITDKGINIIFTDREGNVWFGAESEGLYKLTNEVFTFYGMEHGLETLPLTSVTQDSDGNYWYGSFGKGIQKYDGEKYVKFGLTDGLPSQYISSSAADSAGNLWFGSRGSGLIKFDGNSFSSLTTEDGLAHNFVRQVFVDSHQNIWIGTVSGLSKYDGESFENYNIQSGLAGNLIWGISESNEGEVLIVTREGISQYSDGQLSLIDIDKEVFDKRVNTAVKDNYGNYWIGYSGHGLLRIATNGTRMFVTTQEGLSSDLIYNLLIDSDNNLIVGSERGVDKVLLDEYGRVIRIKSYGQKEGFKGLGTTYNNIFRDNENNIWFGTDDGVFKYDASKEVKNEVEPITYISGLKLFYNEVDWSQYTDNISSWLNIPEKIKLPYSENNLILEYFGVSLSNPKEVKYKFRLLGLEARWSPVTERTEAVYTNLAPGSYTFEVKAANNDDVWSTIPATFQFEITPPFWQRLWFYVLLLVLFFVCFKLYNDYRVRVNLNKILTLERIRSEELQKVRKRMARDFHDNMGNQIASITVFANLINLKLKNKSKEVDDLLQNIQKHTSSLFTGTKDFIWSMDPDSDNLNEIFTYIRDFGEDLYERTPIAFFSNADDFDKHYPLPSGWSRQLVLIFKEAMTNALKHSQATEVHLDLKLSAKDFVITLWDNGVGFNIDEITKGMGMKNMNTRASQLNGEFVITNIEDKKGSKIYFKGIFNQAKLDKTIMT
ncbi:two-component regulator propeller domain-containing protein [Fulvivirga sp.]|uniref:sensor histidine kinase n=1 Tax=Fulvivirga sp. TaxID=1931237 RepID=UPI0032EB9B1B